MGVMESSKRIKHPANRADRRTVKTAKKAQGRTK
jgi:hypothetical protein